MFGKQQLLFLLLVISVVFSALHLGALQLSLYWSIIWFDLVMHFLGGLLVGLFFLWFLLVRGFRASPRKIIGLVIVGVFSIGLFWELFELSIGQLLFADDSLFDTGLDLLFDLLGGAAALSIAGATLIKKDE